MSDAPSENNAPTDPPTGSELLAELADEFAARRRRGERPDVEEYARLHPDLASQMRELFPAIVALEDAGTCGAPRHPEGGPEAAGSVVGRYKLLERLGEGGFGVVYMAEQLTPVRRKVALKVIKPGLDTQQVIARFEAERQALALMDHENIARVLDAGATDTGRPYFVMELVDGVPITDYSETHKLAPRQRLELFVRVCRAVQHAHTKGVIHRDLKPTNILVTVHDGQPVPKVIDFGVAKATAQQLTDGTLFTNLGQIVGTPLYMSPEQAEMGGQDVDTRSDVYGLGVLLYELLTGTTPLDRERLKRAALDEVRRIIREEDPPRPSTRLSALSEQLPADSVRSRTDLQKLGRLVRGELDWIVMKAMEKERALRYETVSGLAADVERYLGGETVQACPRSATYRVRKLLRRYKGPVIVAALVSLAALVGGIISTTWGMVRARDQLYVTLLNQAHLDRVSGRVGQRFDALRTIAKASRIRVTPELRQEAAAALTLPDVELAREWDDTHAGDELTLSFDGATIWYARINQDGVVSIGRLNNGREGIITQLPAYGRSYQRGPLWSEDRRFLTYGPSGVQRDEGAGLRVWRLDGPAPKIVLDEPAGVKMSAFAFHGGGRKCAVARVSGGVSVYDLDTGVETRLPVGTVDVLAFHPRDDRLAIASGTSVRIVDSASGAELKSLQVGQLTSPENIRCIAWHPDGRHVAVGCFDSGLHIIDAESGTEMLPPWHARNRFDSIIFTHSGDRLLSCDRDEESRLWDVATGQPILTIPRHLSENSTFSPDDQSLGFSRDPDRGKIEIWRIASGREIRVLGRTDIDTPRYILNRPILDSSGRIAATAFDRLCFFDIASGEELASAPVPRRGVGVFAFEPVGAWLTGGTRGIMRWPLGSDPNQPASYRVGPPQLVVSGDGGNRAKEVPDSEREFAVGVKGLTHWPGRPGSERVGSFPISPPQPLVSGFGSSVWADSSISRDGKLLAISDSSSAILLHPDRKPLTLGDSVRRSYVSPDGKLVATCASSSDGNSPLVCIWNARDGSHVANLPLTGRANVWGEFSPDGRWLATTTFELSQLWEVGTWGKPVRSYSGCSAFSPDGKLMAVGDVVRCVRLVETASGAEVARLAGPQPGKYLPKCFTPDGTRLIASDLHAMYVWDLRLIREQLREMGLDWDWPPFRDAVPDTRGRLSLTIDTGVSRPSAASRSPSILLPSF